MFPAGIIPPELQWQPTGGQDLFKIELRRGEQTKLTIYTTGDRYRISDAEWRALADSNGGPFVDVLLWGRASGADPATPSNATPSISLEIADASLAGSIYYSTTGPLSGSDGSEGVWRIDEGSDTAFKVLGNTEEGSCHGCHTVSRDGSRIAYSYASNGRKLGLADVTPLAAGNAATAERFEGDPIDGHWFAFNPDGSRLLVSGDDTKLRLYTRDPATDALALDRFVEDDATQPTWSPDGGVVAYIHSFAHDGDANINITSSDLLTRTVTTAADGALVLSEPVVRVASDGLANSYPSFSPDSRWLAYSRGSMGRIKECCAGNNNTHPNSIYLIPTVGGGTPIPLTRAGLPLTAADETFDSNPSFSPFIAGGYYWLLFRSFRPYGHYTQFSDTAHTYQHQLWVTAISAQDLAAGNIDPSRPAFWLPGQDTDTNNMTAQWAQNPCHGEGGACGVTSDCCGGLVCGTNGLCETPAGGCTQQGNRCDTSDQCCSGLKCAPNSAGEETCQFWIN